MSARVNANNLKQLMKDIKQNWTQSPGDALWRCGNGTLEILWSGEEGTMETYSTGESWRIRITGAAMRNLIQALPSVGDLTLRVNTMESQLELGMFSIPCEVLQPPVVQLAPATPSALELLVLNRKHEDETLARTGEGLAQSIAVTEAKLHDSVTDAAEALAWLDIDEAQLRAWIERRLSERTAA